MQKNIDTKTEVHSFSPGAMLRRMPPLVGMMTLAFFVGLLAGAASYILKLSVRWLSAPMTSHFHSGGANWALLILPVIGIVLTGIYQRYVLHKNISHGSERLKKNMSLRRYNMPGDMTYAPIIASTLTLGFGGSAGSEGPIATAGAAIGSRVGRYFHVDDRVMKTMLACGASAGIAGIFKAPVGGVFYSLEILSVSFGTEAMLAIFISSLTAALTAFVLSGCTTDLVFSNVSALSWDWMPWVLVLGIFCGLYSFYYSRIMAFMRKWYEGMKNPWKMNVISGITLAVLVFIFPPLFGEGYNFMTKILADDSSAFAAYGLFAGDAAKLYTPILLALGIIVVKAFACASTNSGGGVAGDFAPTLMAGCVAGFFFASLLNAAFGLQLPVANFAFFGMAAVMAGAIGAPFLAIFITVEMGQTYSMLLPVVIAAAVSYIVVLVLRHLAGLPSIFPKKI